MHCLCALQCNITCVAATEVMCAVSLQRKLLMVDNPAFVIIIQADYVW